MMNENEKFNDDERGTEFEFVDDSDPYWILRDPETQLMIFAVKPATGEEVPVCFGSEEEALEFKRRYKAPDGLIPVFVPRRTIQ